MSIIYNKLLKIMDKHNVTSYTLTKKDKVIGSATWDHIRDNGHIDTRTIDALCTYFKCQPGDLMEWVPEQDTPKE